MQRNFRLRHDITLAIRDNLSQQGFLEIETPILYQVHARGRARFSGAQPRSSRRVLRAAAVAADLQADSDDLRLRPLLPDRPLLPRRGPEGRPPARVHAGRSGDELPAAGDGLRRRWSSLWRRALRAAGVTLPTPFPRISYDEAMRQFGTDKPDLRLPGLTDVRAAFTRRGAGHAADRSRRCRWWRCAFPTSAS